MAFWGGLGGRGDWPSHYLGTERRVVLHSGCLTAACLSCLCVCVCVCVCVCTHSTHSTAAGPSPTHCHPMASLGPGLMTG